MLMWQQYIDIQERVEAANAEVVTARAELERVKDEQIPLLNKIAYDWGGWWWRMIGAGVFKNLLIFKNALKPRMLKL